jgi:hypothetical protein
MESPILFLGPLLIYLLFTGNLLIGIVSVWIGFRIHEEIQFHGVNRISRDIKTIYDFIQQYRSALNIFK